MSKKLVAIRFGENSLKALAWFKAKGKTYTQTVEEALNLYQAVEMRKEIEVIQKNENVIQG
ncbi:MAG: hypothetical protein ACOX1V_02030 [Candidatus Iainarchaeum sp.]